MSTDKHIDQICIIGAAVTVILTVLFMCGKALGMEAAERTVKYESTLFDTSYVHSIDIVMNGWDDFIADCESEEYSPCTLVVDGVKHSNVAIRAKGNTSLSSVRSMGSERYSFKLEFDHYEGGKTLDGLDKLCLNNMIQDNTMMKDYLVYRLMKDFGANSPLCSYAYLTVNGEDWGLYLAVEGVEDSFLTRNYGSDAGELYKPDSLSFGGGRGNGKEFNMDDFDWSSIRPGTAGNDGGNGENSGENGTREGSGSGFPGGFNGGFPGGFNGGFPGGSSDDAEGGMPDMGDIFGGEIPDTGDFSGGELPNKGDFSGSGIPDMGEPDGGTRPETPGAFGGMGGFGGMGSDDVKLKYIDDDPDSYPNIFDNAKTAVSSADRKRLIASLKKLSACEDLEEVLNTEEVLRYFTVHNFVCNGDSYTGSMIHNYYLHESDGQLSMIPWDYNLAFGTFMGGNAASSVNADIDSPVSGGNVNDRPMLGWIFSDGEYTEKYHGLFAAFLEKWFSDGQMEKLIADTAEMLRPYVEKDPTKFCTQDEFEKGAEALTQFVTLRAEAVRRQLAGDDTAVETGSLNLSDMGSMGGGRTERSDGSRQEPPSDAPEGSQPDNKDESSPNGLPAADRSGGLSRTVQGGSGGMPSGGFNGSFPGDFPGNIPGGSAEQPEEPSVAASETAAESGKNGTEPAGKESGSSVGGSAAKESRSSGKERSSSGMPTGKQNRAVQTERWILVGISVLVLAGGLWIVVKYRR